MASLFKKKHTPFWYLRFKTESGEWDQRSLKLYHGRRTDDLEAERILRETHLAELTLHAGTKQGEEWDLWTHSFLESQYGNSKNTLTRYRNCLRAVLIFLKEVGLQFPRQVRYNDVRAYMDWRRSGKTPGVFKAAHNTVLTDLKVFRIIMREAVRRGFSTSNPVLSLGIKKHKVKEKPELTDDDILAIRAELLREERGVKVWPEWMRVSFEIALHQGCRLRETSMPLADIDVDRGIITFNAKGGKRHATALNPLLIPMIQGLRKLGRETTCDMPHMPSKFFWLLFKKIKRSHLCFHSTRVTAATRFARAGVPLAQAMRFLGHASETIHRVYQRLKVEDLSLCVAALTFEGKNPPHENSGSPASKQRPPRK